MQPTHQAAHFVQHLAVRHKVAVPWLVALKQQARLVAVAGLHLQRFEGRHAVGAGCMLHLVDSIGPHGKSFGERELRSKGLRARAWGKS